MGADDRHRGGVLVGRGAGEDLEGGAGESVLVGAPVDVAARELFGGGVGDGAYGELAGPSDR